MRTPMVAHVFSFFVRMLLFHACRYHVYRLDDQADDRRHVAANGWDRYSPKGTLARLASLARGGDGAGGDEGSWARDELEEELLGVRAMRHIWKVKPNASREEWRVLLGPLAPFRNASRRQAAAAAAHTAHQWVLTRVEEPLIEPVNPPRPRSIHKLLW